MWKRRELKRDARGSLKKNYWSIIAVCFLLALMAAEYGNSVQSVFEYNSSKEDTSHVVSHAKGHKDSNSERIMDLIDAFLGNDSSGTAVTATKGVLASAFNGFSRGKADLFSLINVYEKFVVKHSVMGGLIALLGFTLAVLYIFFVRYILQVGERRFFMETRLYKNTGIGRILYIYSIRQTRHVAYVMFMRWVFLLLWWLTIVGGFIKTYEYKMIAYLLAENPEMSRKEAFALSKELMRGNKWRAFVIDLSFLWWTIPSVITFGLLSIFFINPYKRGTETELYMALRENAIAEKTPLYELLNDNNLAVNEQNYTLDKYPGLNVIKKKVIHIDYNVKYTVANIVLIFFAFAFIGWLWEVSLHIVEDGVFVNRGTMHGPWLPIYGSGGAVVIVLLKRWADKPIKFFLLTMVACGIIEYATSWFLETTKGEKWWDYSGYLLNINGRICLEGLLVFAIAGCLAVYIIGPVLNKMFNKIPNNIKYPLCGVLLAAFGADFVYSHYHPNTGSGITDYGNITENETAALPDISDSGSDLKV